MRWIWVIWAISVMASLFCVAKKLAKDIHFASPLSPISPYIYGNTTARRVLVGLGLALWLGCFGSQLLVLNESFKIKNISYEWSLGQIIAVTVWIPSLIEFAYIEYSKNLESFWALIHVLTKLVGIEAASEYRYPSPMRVMKGIVFQSVNLAILDPSEESREELMTTASGGDWCKSSSSTNSVAHTSLIQLRRP